MPDVLCPECGLVTTVPAMRRAADEFCTHCDYPLFWAPSAVPVSTGGEGSDTTLRRLPGAGGRQLIGTRVCLTCGELNGLVAQFCTRCGNDMDPPVIVPEPEPEPEPLPPPPPPPPPPGFDWAPIIVLVVSLLVAAGLILFL